MIENKVYQSAIDVLALLVRNRAGSLAGGLAGSLALAAAALNSALLQVCFIQGLNLSHLEKLKSPILFFLENSAGQPF